MGRNEEFFHGSDHKFAPGDFIDPAEDTMPEEGRWEAHATDVPEVAKAYGKHVYKVSPVDSSEELGEHLISAHGKQGTHYTSTKGFKVLGKVNVTLPERHRGFAKDWSSTGNWEWHEGKASSSSQKCPVCDSVVKAAQEAN